MGHGAREPTQDLLRVRNPGTVLELSVQINAVSRNTDFQPPLDWDVHTRDPERPGPAPETTSVTPAP